MNRPGSAPLGALLLGALLACAACASYSSKPSAQAERITRAIYNDDVAGAVADFDDATKAQMTRAQIGQLSDRMHAFGTLSAIVARTGADPDKGRYDYDVNFSAGSMLLQMRVDPTGKVGAYRLVPQQVPPGAPGAVPASQGAAR